MFKQRNKIQLMTWFSLLLLLITTIVPYNVFSFDVNAEEYEPRTDGEQRIDGNNLQWTPVSNENPLGGADDFSAIFFDTFKNFNESGGPVAAKTIDNVDIITFEEGLIGNVNQFFDYAIPRYNVGLIAQESILEKSIRVQNGDAIIGDNADGSLIDKETFGKNGEGSIFVDQEKVNQFMADAEADIKQLNNEIWNLFPTSDVEINGNDITLNLTEEVNVFELNPNINNGNININYDEDLKGSTIIIKANTNTININNTFVNDEMINFYNIDDIVNRIIWVFDPSIQEVDILKSQIMGSVIAPNADFKLRDGYSAINGTIVANGLEAFGQEARGSEFHYTGGFIGVVPKEDPEVPKEEETSPVDPVVEQAYCDEEGNPVDPTIQLDETEGIHYEIDGEVAAGNIVTVTATAEEGYILAETDGWVLNEDGIASRELVLEDVNCEEEPEDPKEVTPTGPDVEQAYCDEEGNPVDPTIQLDETEGIHYEIDGEVAAGNIVTVTATAEEGYILAETDGWVLNEDGIASRELVLEDVNCEEEPEDPKEVTPTGPDVEQAYCDEEGNPVDPTIQLDETEGIHYAIDGEVVAGNTVTITATAEEGYTLVETDGWVLNEDGMASQELVLENVDCEEVPEEEVSPVDPVVEQAYCDEEGNPVDPTIQLGDTEGIHYAIDGEVVAGNTVTITATAEEGYTLSETDGWVLNEDGTASQELVLENVDCEEVPEEEEVNPVDPVVEQAYCDEEGNPVDPIIQLDDNEGITYAIDGEVVAGNTVTITATAEEGYTLVETDGWVLNEDGTASQELVLEDVNCEEVPEEEEASPVDPVVEQAYCDEEGNPVDPTIQLDDTEGIHYGIEGEVVVGNTVTITATAEEGYTLSETDGWVLNEDGTASLELVLENVDCEEVEETPQVCEVPKETTVKVNAGDKVTGTVTKQDDVTYRVGDQPSHGQVVVNEETGEWEYQSDAAFVGEDEFSIYLVDEQGNIICEEIIYVTVDEVDDPVIDSSDDEKEEGNKLPITATNVFNGLAAGIVLFILGGLMFFKRRHGNQQS